MGWLSGLVWTGGAAFAVAAVMLYIYQESLLYFPNMPVRHPHNNPKGVRHPGEMGLPYEDMFMVTKDGVRIHGWLIKQPNASKVPTIVYFHGNAGNIGFRLPNAAEVYRRCGVNVFLVEYRGYGRSEGTPTEAGLLLDALAAIDTLRSNSDSNRTTTAGAGVDPNKIVLFGRSLGGAVAVAAAAAVAPEKVAAVVVENTFLSVGHMVDVVLPVLRPLKPLVLRMKWPSDESIPNITQPVLFISGQEDELVPPWHMERLFELCSKSRGKRMLRVKSGTHNDTWLRAGDRYYEVLKEFIEQALSAAGANRVRKSSEVCVNGSDGAGSAAAAGSAADTQARGAADAIPIMPKFGLGPGVGSRQERQKEE